MPFFKKINNQKGVTAILLSLLILGVTLLIAMGLSLIFIGEIKNSSLIGRSGPAFYAADAGAEYALYQFLQNDIQLSPDDTKSLNPNTDFVVSWDSGAAPTPYIRSLGTYGETRRKIEINW